MKNSDLELQALKTLSEDELFYWDFIDPVLTGIVTVLDADKDGVLEKVKSGNTWHLMAKTREKAEEYAEILKREKAETICVHDEIALEAVKRVKEMDWEQVPCYVFVGNNDHVKEIQTDLTFKKLDHSYDEFVSLHYGLFKNNPYRLQEAYKSIERGVFGGFLGDQIVGFIGTHSEGTMGMLEILPEFRRRGYGRALEQYLANVFIESKRKPYCHVLENNYASIALQRELGFETREDKRVYWMG